jgi:hypothetical protein
MPRHTEIAHLSSPYLDLINDAFIGSGVGTGIGTQPYAGQLGAFMELTEAQAANMGSVLTLHSGIYQYVQFKAGSTAANAKGQIVFYANATDRAAYTVTPDVTAATQGMIAGITLGTITKGNYGYIQVGGVANVLFKTGLTAATPAIGDLVIVDQTPTFAADDPTQSGNPTYLILKSVLGVAQAAPVSATISLVQLWPRFWNE